MALRYIINGSKKSVPDATTESGTVSLNAANHKRIVGVGTSFLTAFTNIKLGQMYMFFPTTGEICLVESIESDTALLLNVAPTIGAGVAYGAVFANLRQVNGQFTGGNGTIRYPDGTSTTVLANFSFQIGDLAQTPHEAIKPFTVDTAAASSVIMLNEQID